MAAAAATAVVPSSTVVLLLGQLPDDPLQLLAGLLLVLQELLHPFVLLLVVGKEQDVKRSTSVDDHLSTGGGNVNRDDEHAHLFQLVDLVL